MTIEEEIKQSKGFKNIYHKLAINLMYTNSWLEIFVKAYFKREQLTPQQYNILRILRGSRPNPLSTLQIRERMMDKMSDTSRIVDRLVLKKLVSKKLCPADQRLVDIRITDKGLQVLAKLDGIADEVAVYLNNVTEEEAKTISDLLDKLHDTKAKAN